MISNAKFADWCEGISDYIEAGIDITSYLEDSAEGYDGKRDKKFDKYNSKIYESLKKGKTFHESIILPGSLKSGFYPAVIKTGEISGNLAGSLKMISDYLKFQLKVQKEIRGLVINLFLKMLALITYFSGAIILLTIIGKEEIDLLGLGLHGYRGAGILMAWGLGICSVFFLLVLLIKAIKNKPWFQKISFNLPVLGNCLQAFLMYRFTFILKLVFNTELGIEESLSLAYQSSGSAKFESYLEPVLERIKRGRPLHRALMRHPKLPEKFMRSIKFAEKSGSLPTASERLCDQYQSESEKRLQEIVRKVQQISKGIMFAFCLAGVGSIMNSVAIQPMIHLFGTVFKAL